MQARGGVTLLWIPYRSSFRRIGRALQIQLNGPGFGPELSPAQPTSPPDAGLWMAHQQGEAGSHRCGLGTGHEDFSPLPSAQLRRGMGRGAEWRGDEGFAKTEVCHVCPRKLSGASLLQIHLRVVQRMATYSTKDSTKEHLQVRIIYTNCPLPFSLYCSFPPRPSDHMPQELDGTSVTMRLCH
jgi:hypothetical protein